MSYNFQSVGYLARFVTCNSLETISFVIGGTFNWINYNVFIFIQKGCYIQRGYQLKGMDKPENEQVNCYCSDLVAYHSLLSEAIEEMKADGEFPLEFEQQDKGKK